MQGSCERPSGRCAIVATPSFNVVPANAGTHTPRPRVLARWLMVSAPTDSGGYGSPRSRGRPIVWRVRNQLIPTDFNFRKQRRIYASAFPRREAPELCRNHSPMRARGMPGARCTRSLVCSVLVAHECSHHGRTGTPGIPARNGFNGFVRALPGDRAFLSPSPALVLADLTPASRRQDHTTSPSASAPFVNPRCRVHRIPPRVRDDRDTPLGGTRRRSL
jgi:hypothetical protein